MRGFLIDGSVTLLTSQGPPGKTPLLSQLLHRLKRGIELDGLAVVEGKAVPVEPAELWLKRTKHAPGSVIPSALSSQVEDFPLLMQLRRV